MEKGRELAKCMAGGEEFEPSPLLRRLALSYLASCLR